MCIHTHVHSNHLAIIPHEYIPTGQVVANLSAADLRKLSTSSEHFEAYGMWTVREFLQHLIDIDNSSTDEVKGGEGKEEAYAHYSHIQQPWTVSTKATLYSTASIIISNHFHRVWVVDRGQEDKIVGCVSLTDVIRAISNH